MVLVKNKLAINKINNLPRTPGVYFFYNKKEEILYVGKAKNLLDRVKSHFQSPSFKDSLFANEIIFVGYLELNSDIEALIKESYYIKTLRPKFNTLLKDDKNYFYVGVTQEDVPRIYLTHQTKIQDSDEAHSKFYGPFTDGTALKATLHAIRRFFPYRTCKTIPKKPCAYYQLSLCPGCPMILDDIQKIHEYQTTVKNIISIITGKRDLLAKKLEKEMREAASQEKFERAREIRDQIYGLERIFKHSFLFVEPNYETGLLEIQNHLNLEKVPKRIEGYDISNIQGTQASGSMVVFVNGQPEKNEYRKFKIKTKSTPDDYAMMHEVLTRRLTRTDWDKPDLLFVDGGKGQLNVAKSVTRELNLNIPICSLAKGTNTVFSSTVRQFPLDFLEKDSRMIILMLRDEAHRFALAYHRKLASNL